MSIFGISLKQNRWSMKLPAFLRDRVLWTLVAGLAALTVWDQQQGLESLRFTLANLAGIAPYLLSSIALAAYAKASGADNLIARAFTGRETTMILFAALMGGLSPFCSCGVIPLIAALLSMGVPLAPVMAFWLASPLMDPSMFFLTAGTLGLEFAVFKTFAAVSVGLLGGFGTFVLIRGGAFSEPLREGVGDGGCGASSVRNPKEVVWRFWKTQERRERFGKNALDNTLFLGKWLLATIVGVPAYLNGYAALPLIGGLIEQGMAPGAGMSFLLAGGVSSIPAAIAVWALARPPVFAAYLLFAFAGAFSLGTLYSLLAWS